MKTKFFLIACLCAAMPLAAQVRIHGFVLDADSNAVAGASVRIPGLDSKLSNTDGYFEFRMAKEMAEEYFLKAGSDLFVEVQKEGMVLLEPPDGFLRLPRNADYQKPHTILLAQKGSLALLRSARMLEYVFRQRLNASIESKEKEFARQLEMEKAAARLGLSEAELTTAVDQYKESLRSSDDLNLRGLAALDDANAAATYEVRDTKLTEARKSFLEAERKDRRTVHEGRAAEKRLPEIWFNLGQTYFSEARYHSAAYYFNKADSAAPGNTEHMNMLGRALGELARYDEALATYQLALAIDTTQHGRNHPNVAMRLNNIGGVLHFKGDYSGALEKLTEALTIDKNYFGRSHPRAATDLNNIGEVLKAKGDYSGALEKYNEALTILSNAFGETHPNISKILNNIAEVLISQGDYMGALEKYSEALTTDELYFGRTHPNVATDLNNIAAVLHSQGDYAGALEKYYKALTIYEQAFGRMHPNAGTVLNNIGEVLQAKGDYGGALEKYNEALTICENAFGRTHPNVATVLNNIAVVLHFKGDYSGALEKLTEALAIHKNYFGHNHPGVATDLNNIGGVLEAKGDYGGALEKYNEALTILRNAFGDTHPNIAKILNNIAGVLISQGDYMGALEKSSEALTIDELYFGRTHPNVATDLNNIGGVLESQGNYAGALEKYGEALTIDELYFGRTHPNVATDLNNIGGVLESQGNYAGALEKYGEALTIDELYFGRNHPQVAIRLNNIGEVLRAKGDYAGALEKYNEALTILTKFLGPDHPNTQNVRENMQQAWWQSLSETERLHYQTQFYLLHLNDATTGKADSLRLALLNQIGAGYIKQQKPDSALIYLKQALPLAEKSNNLGQQGMVFNNLGSAHKSLQDWVEAQRWLEKSIAHNRALLDDSAVVLAYSYFHLAGVYHAQSQPDSARFYAQKSLALCEHHALAELQEKVRVLLGKVGE